MRHSSACRLAFQSIDIMRTGGVRTGGGTGVLLDVAALADEVVLGLVAGKAALGLGAELSSVALGSAGNLALGKHGGGSASTAARFVVVRSVNCRVVGAVRGKQRWMKQLTRFWLSSAGWCEVRPRSAHFSVRPRVCVGASLRTSQLLAKQEMTSFGAGQVTARPAGGAVVRDTCPSCKLVGRVGGRTALGQQSPVAPRIKGDKIKATGRLFSNQKASAQ